MGLSSSGLHTNGYSLARKIITERMHLGVGDDFPRTGQTVADVLLTVHRSYLALLLPLLEKIHAMAHITGGGLPGNLGRALPSGLDTVVDTSSWEVPSFFEELQKAGQVPREEMFRVFNMGVGMIVIVPPESADVVIREADASGIGAWTMGEVRPGSGDVVIT